ncbi:leucine zipper factor-like protein [Galdieria sulphuraria]|uniref:Leucine zipper factor-like protein n=1 Tax=Galdieria sulphuraria TaxID=130081 RepID=M2Y3B0_GALSU|nr:leucine zipper factor-like protein [Galdieria sulphuraria]EME30443.1 leucine zipper factor-like protein [Galdieria sulphuraria]|eukprot:XP_005706963.1 leucine zipper factor-like protein [Galdieria sulphuraria]
MLKKQKERKQRPPPLRRQPYKEQQLPSEMFEDKVDESFTKRVDNFAESTEREERESSENVDSPENFRELYDESSSSDEQDSETSVSEVEDEFTESDTWGTDRKNYYGADGEDVESLSGSEVELIMKEEEQESRRLQERQLSTLDKEDLEVSQLMDNNKDQILEKEGALRTQGKDWETLTTADKLRIIEKDSPELVKLLQDFQEKSGEVFDSLEPVIDKAKNFKNMYSDGMSLLELKYHLLLNYCINIAFFMLLKAQGVTVKDHPVLDQLIELRVIMEKMKPLEEKLQYQIHKLVDLARGKKENTTTYDKDDEKTLKPKPASLIAFDDDSQSDYDYEQDADGLEDKKRLYRPPRILPTVDAKSMHKTHVRQLEDEKLEKVEEENWKDSYMELEELPESLHGGLLSQDTDKLTNLIETEKERQKYEEANFTRLFTEKKEQKLQRKMRSMERDLIVGSDFGQEFDTLISMADHLVSSKPTDHNLKEVSFKSQEDFASSVGSEKGDQDSSESDIEDDLTCRRRSKIIDGNFPTSIVSGEIPKGSRRKAQRAQLENRGLTPKRKKLLKNPRVKQKKRYDTAQKKRRGMSRNFISISNSLYRGESSGINIRK